MSDFTKNLTFDDFLKMGWKKSYILLHDIVRQDMEYQEEKQRQIIRKKQLIERRLEK